MLHQIYSYLYLFLFSRFKQPAVLFSSAIVWVLVTHIMSSLQQHINGFKNPIIWLENIYFHVITNTPVKPKTIQVATAVPTCLQATSACSHFGQKEERGKKMPAP